MNRYVYTNGYKKPFALLSEQIWMLKSDFWGSMAWPHYVEIIQTSTLDGVLWIDFKDKDSETRTPYQLKMDSFRNQYEIVEAQ